MTLGISILILSLAAAGYSAWRIYSLRKFRPLPGDESIKVITDRFERDMEEIFRNWGKQ